MLNLSDDDIAALSDVVLYDLAARFRLERDRRETSKRAADGISKLVREVFDAAGGDGQPWKQPTGAHDSFPINVVVTHKGKVWRSTIDFNSFEPGVQGWKLETDDECPEFVQPTSTEYYNQGDPAMFDGVCYESLINTNVYSPAEYPAGWKVRNV